MHKNIEQLFFDLIQVSLGKSTSLPYKPDEKEWEEMFRMSKKQCIWGICFAGITKLQKEKLKIQRSLYINWVANVANIQDSSSKLQEECRFVYDKLKEEGFDCCIMKGQSLAPYYGELAPLRQSGDIDVLVANDELQVLKYACKKEGKGMEWSYKHVHINTLCSTEVDLHYRPVMSRNLARNKKLQEWCKEIKARGFVYDENLGFATLRLDDNIVFVLYHIWWHFLFEGVGLRQVMDLFFLLCYAESYLSDKEKTIVRLRLKEFNLEKFASAVSWVMWYVFEGKCDTSILISDNAVLPHPNEKEGMFLLSEIMESGNMGHEDSRTKWDSSDNDFIRFVKKAKFYSRLMSNYPSEFLWIPIGSLYVRYWRRKIKKQIF